MTLNFFRLGATSSAVLEATSPAFSASRIRTPGTFPLTKSATISSAGSCVRFWSPAQFLSLVTMTGVLIFRASNRVSARMHCSSRTMTSGMPLLMKRSCHEIGPTILAFELYRVVSWAVQHRPVTSTSAYRSFSLR